MIFRDGDVYEGDFQRGKMTGSGTYTFKSGTSYTGQFTDGKMDGYGIMTYRAETAMKAGS